MSTVPDIKITEPETSNQNPISQNKNTESSMERINATILKTAIEAIPLLTSDNFTMWKNRVENMLDLQGLRIPLTSEDGALSANEDIQLRTIITSKLDSAIHPNVINHENEKKAR